MDPKLNWLPHADLLAIRSAAETLPAGVCQETRQDLDVVIENAKVKLRAALFVLSDEERLIIRIKLGRDYGPGASEELATLV